MQVKVTPARRQDKGAADCRGPNDLAVDDAPQMLQYRVPVVSGFGDSGVFIGAQQYRIGSVDTKQAQLAQSMGDGVRIVAPVGRQGFDRVAGPLADALNATRRIALEDRAVFGEGDLFDGVL